MAGSENARKHPAMPAGRGDQGGSVNRPVQGPPRMPFDSSTERGGASVRSEAVSTSLGFLSLQGCDRPGNLRRWRPWNMSPNTRCAGPR